MKQKNLGMFLVILMLLVGLGLVVGLGRGLFQPKDAVAPGEANTKAPIATVEELKLADNELDTLDFGEIDQELDKLSASALGF